MFVVVVVDPASWQPGVINKTGLAHRKSECQAPPESVLTIGFSSIVFEFRQFIDNFV